jgi:hypothetical protein
LKAFALLLLILSSLREEKKPIRQRKSSNFTIFNLQDNYGNKKKMKFLILFALIASAYGKHLAGFPLIFRSGCRNQLFP